MLCGFCDLYNKHHMNTLKVNNVIFSQNIRVQKP